MKQYTFKRFPIIVCALCLIGLMVMILVSACGGDTTGSSKSPTKRPLCGKGTASPTRRPSPHSTTTTPTMKSGGGSPTPRYLTSDQIYPNPEGVVVFFAQAQGTIVSNPGSCSISVPPHLLPQGEQRAELSAYDNTVGLESVQEGQFIRVVAKQNPTRMNDHYVFTALEVDSADPTTFDENRYQVGFGVNSMDNNSKELTYWRVGNSHLQLDLSMWPKVEADKPIEVVVQVQPFKVLDVFNLSQ